VGSCTLAACPAGSNGTDVLTGCTTLAGYTGTITAAIHTNGYTGSCTAAACPANSNGTDVLTGCTCDAGYNGTGTITAATNTNGYTGSCTAVACPVNSTGTDVPTGCTCDAGYTGTITAATNADFYTGSCTAVACPADSTGTDVPTGCTCNAGYTGTITAATNANGYTGSCTAVACPAGSTGTDVPTGCTCDAGYTGTITAAIHTNGYTGSCTAVMCPGHTTGTDVPTGCTCISGFSGTITATMSYPWYSGFCTKGTVTTGTIGVPYIAARMTTVAASTVVQFQDIAVCKEWTGEIKETRELGYGCAAGLCDETHQLHVGATVTSTPACRRALVVTFKATMPPDLYTKEFNGNVNVVTLTEAINAAIDALGKSGTLTYLNTNSTIYVTVPLVETIPTKRSNMVVVASASVLSGVTLLVLTSALILHFRSSPPKAMVV